MTLRFLKPLIWQNQKCSLKVGFNTKLLLTFWNLFWNYHCILLQESSAATTLVLSERQHFEWNSSDKKQILEIKNKTLLKCLHWGFGIVLAQRSKGMVMLLSFIKTSIWCFGHMKRKVSPPTPDPALMEHHHPSHILKTVLVLCLFCFRKHKGKNELSKTCVA